MNALKSIVELLTPEEWAIERCDHQNCRSEGIALVGEFAELTLCAAHAAEVIMGLIRSGEVRAALKVALGHSVLNLDP